MWYWFDGPSDCIWFSKLLIGFCWLDYQSTLSVSPLWLVQIREWIKQRAAIKACDCVQAEHNLPHACTKFTYWLHIDYKRLGNQRQKTQSVQVIIKNIFFKIKCIVGNEYCHWWPLLFHYLLFMSILK